MDAFAERFARNFSEEGEHSNMAGAHSRDRTEKEDHQQ
jgi:hypothetical protein